MTKEDILKKMKETFENEGYHQAYRVYNENRLEYPERNSFHKRAEEVENNFRGTLAEINAALEKAKEEDKAEYTEKMRAYNADCVELRSKLVDYAAEEGLPSPMNTNRDFIRAISYYALSEDEPYNWASEFSEFWDCYEKAQNAIKKSMEI